MQLRPVRIGFTKNLRDRADLRIFTHDTQIMRARVHYLYILYNIACADALFVAPKRAAIPSA